MTIEPEREGNKSAWPYAVLGLACLLFYLPALISTDAVNSDSSIVALQAKHFLHGEFSWLLWGAPYQGAVYPAYLAIFLAVLPARPWIIPVAALPALFASAAFACSMLRRSLDDVTATLAALLIILSPQAVNIFTIFPLRQLVFAIFMAAIWMLHSSLGSRHWRWRITVGTLLGGIALYTDYFVLQLLPALAVMIALICLQRPMEKHGPSVQAKIKFCFLGFVLVLCWFSAEWLSLGHRYSATSFGLSHFNFNLNLLWRQALPYALGYRVQIKDVITLRPVDFSVPLWIQVLQCIVAATMGIAILSGIVLAANRRVFIEARRLGVVGAVAALSSITCFLVSVAPVDIWSARYLVPILLMAPLAITPLATRMPRRWFQGGLAIYLCFAAAAGWISQHRDHSWFIPTPDAAHAQDLHALREVLRQHEVHYAIADYWLSYRLTFLFNEDPIVIPFIEKEDRYAPYRQAFSNATRSAMIFHPDFPSPHAAGYEQFLQDEHYHYQRINVGPFLVFIVDGPRRIAANQ